MSGASGMPSDWRDRHPFKLGDQVVRKNPAGPNVVSTVAMRGESERGLWIAFEGVPYEFAAADFELLSPDAVTVTLQPSTGEAA